MAPLSAFGIPENIHSVPGCNSTVVERNDLNQFGVKFQGYALLEIVDLTDLGNLLHSSQDESFELLKKLSLRMLEASREDTMAGFQPLLGKVMVGDSDKDYFYEVQEHATIEHYATIWAKVLWLAWLAVMGSGTLHRRLELTNDRKTAVHDLIHRVGLLKSRAGITDSNLDSSALASVARLSMTVLLQQFDVVNRVLPSGESGVSQYLIPRAINLLSLRPNGPFLSYMQITHITAAIRYALRSIIIPAYIAQHYALQSCKSRASICGRNHIDDECARFLVPQRSTSFSYCVQPPWITWATDDFSALRLPSGSILTISSRKEFIYEQYKLAEDATGDLFLGLEIPTHYARDSKDIYNVSRPGYSFLTEPMSRLPKHTSTLQSRFIDADGIMSRPARAYLKSVTKFLEELFILLHVFSRIIYCHSRGLIFLGQYNKTTSLTGVERFIVHLLPSRLERLFLGYLIYIRPLEKYSC
ncbi:hypothetical protein V1524DRAFT_450145 [Lipomyces starkeyi]